MTQFNLSETKCAKCSRPIQADEEFSHAAGKFTHTNCQPNNYIDESGVMPDSPNIKTKTVKLVKMRCYHVRGWKRGTQFRLHDWNETTATIRRPLSGGKFWKVPIWKLENTKRHGG